MSRSWSRVAAGDAVWRSVWLREARSLHHLESRIAAPIGPGFRAAVAQLRAAALVAYEPEWELADYSVAVDISWRGRPLFSAHGALNQMEFDEDGEYYLALSNLLHADESFAPLCLRTVRRAVMLSDNVARAEATATARSLLALRLMVCRSDGAMACLVDGTSSNRSSEERDRSVTPIRWFASSFFWDSDDGDGDVPFYGIADEGSSLAFAVHWTVVLEALAEGDSDASFSSCTFYLTPAEDVEMEMSPELMLSGLSTLRWVTPAESVARAASAIARQASADAKSKMDSSDDDPSDGE